MNEKTLQTPADKSAGNPRQNLPAEVEIPMRGLRLQMKEVRRKRPKRRFLGFDRNSGLNLQ